MTPLNNNHIYIRSEQAPEKHNKKVRFSDFVQVPKSEKKLAHFIKSYIQTRN